MNRDQLIQALQSMPENLPVHIPNPEEYWPEVKMAVIRYILVPDEEDQPVEKQVITLEGLL